MLAMRDITIADATGSPWPANEAEPGHLSVISRPCPRTVRVDGTLEADGFCAGCGACLFPVLEAWA